MSASFVYFRTLREWRNHHKTTIEKSLGIALGFAPGADHLRRGHLLTGSCGFVHGKLKSCFAWIGGLVVATVVIAVVLRIVVDTGESSRTSGTSRARTTGESTEDASKAAILSDPEVARLDAEARAIPASQLEENLVAYEKLLERVPDSERYKRKVAHHKAKIEERGAVPAFRVVAEEPHDSPVKAQIMQKIVVDEKL